MIHYASHDVNKLISKRTEQMNSLKRGKFHY
jgi:hypothetical protein